MTSLLSRSTTRTLEIIESVRFLRAMVLVDEAYGKIHVDR